MPEQFLAIADADKIHDYVFSPHGACSGTV
jgi:hypothetical protein